MALAELSSLAGTIAAVAVVAALLYLAMQLRRYVKATRFAASQNYLERNIQFISSLSQDEELSRIFRLALNTPSRLSDQERNRFALFLLSFIANAEAYFYNYERGYAEPELFENAAVFYRRLLLQTATLPYLERRPGPISRRFLAFLKSATPRQEKKTAERAAGDQTQTAGAVTLSIEQTHTAAAQQRPVWVQRIAAALHRLSRSSRFALAASIILGLTMFFVGNLVTTTLENAAVQSAADAGALYMTTFLEPYVQELSTTSQLSAASVKAIDQLMTSPALLAHVVSVKIWSPEGIALYSTDKSLMNKQFMTPEITMALSGKTMTEWELSKAENAYERGLGIPIYEVYAPLREFGTGRVIAVGEFYERGAVLIGEVEQIRYVVWSIVGTATAAMLLLLLFFVRGGERIIQQQQQALNLQLQEQERLHLGNAVLQRKITAANQAFSRVNELTLRRIGADLHDGPAQLLTLILVRLDELGALQTQVRRAGDLPEANALETLRSAAQDALREIRDISRGLVLPEINDQSLLQMLELVVQRHEQRSKTTVELNCKTFPESLLPQYKVCLYRFVQEALNNAYHHAQGKGQKVCVYYTGGILELQVADSGNGIAIDKLTTESTGRSRLGLPGMRYRVESLGGAFRIESVPNIGTMVTARFRLEQAEQQDA